MKILLLKSHLPLKAAKVAKAGGLVGGGHLPQQGGAVVVGVYFPS